MLEYTPSDECDAREGLGWPHEPEPMDGWSLVCSDHGVRATSVRKPSPVFQCACGKQLRIEENDLVELYPVDYEEKGDLPHDPESDNETTLPNIRGK